MTDNLTEQPETVEGVDWSKPIEAFHTDGRVRACKVGQLNAGVNAGNDHWLWTADSRRLDSTPGALGSFWVSRDGAVPSYSDWRIRNAASHPTPAGASMPDDAVELRKALIEAREYILELVHSRSCEYEGTDEDAVGFIDAVLATNAPDAAKREDRT